MKFPSHFIMTLARMLVLLSMIHASGLGLNATQAFAWTSMLCSNSQDYGWREGWQRTFDGEHPCKLCCCIKKVRENSSPLDSLAGISLHEVRLPIPPMDYQPMLPPLRLAGEKDNAGTIAYRFSLSLWSSSPWPPPPRNA